MKDQGQTHVQCEVLPLSLAQHWLFHRVRHNPSVPVHSTIVLDLVGRLCRRSLRAALDQMVHRHRVLRTVFRQVDGVSVSLVGPTDSGLALMEQNVESELNARHLLQEENRIPFDVGSGPLVRARLVRLAEHRHWILISVHPLVADRSTFTNILSELRDLYSLWSRARSDVTLKPVIQYADVARARMEAISPEAIQTQLSYWKRGLLGAPDLGHLHTDRRRPAVQSYSTARHMLEISEELTRALREVARCSVASLSTVLVGAWSVLLNRWSGQSDLTIGVPFSLQRAPRSEVLLGPLENMLPIRVLISASTTTGMLLKQIDSAFLAAAAHQDVPIDCIADALRPLREGRPIFQSAITLSETALHARAGMDFAPGELQVREITEARSQSGLDIAISLSLEGEAMTGVVEYAAELFEERTIDRICKWWTVLLSAMAGTPEVPVSQLPMLTAAERYAVLSEFNNVNPSWLEPGCVHHIVEDYAEQIPQAIAVTDGDSSITFDELNRRANQLARLLRRRGMRKGDLGAICLSLGIDSVVATVAILKAGGAYIAGSSQQLRGYEPRAPDQFPPRLCVSVVGAGDPREIRDSLVVSMDDDAACIGRESDENLALNDSTPVDAACVIQCAGRKGRHCWVIVEHRNITSAVASIDERLHFAQHDVWALCHPISSQLSLLELWGALLTGGQAAIIPQHVSRDAGPRWLVLSGHQVTVLIQKPSEFLALTEKAGECSPGLLHTVILVGEPLNAAVLRAWFELRRRWPRLVYLYGPAGLTVAGAYSRISSHQMDGKSTGRLAGVPLSSSRFYVLDSHRQPSPIGVVGDIYVAGASVARHYIENGRQHRRRSYFCAGAQERLYRTGDRGAWNADGVIEVACHGAAASNSEIEAARIENELLAHPSVRDVSVVVSSNANGRDALLAYVKCARGTASASELRTFLEQNVPAYMVPTVLVPSPNSA